MHLIAAARFQLRPRRATTNADQRRATPEVGSEGFDWLAGATGVRLGVHVRNGLQTVSAAGDIDHASIDVIESVLYQTFQHLPAQVELDLSRVSFIDDSAGEMITRAMARARAENVTLHITPPAAVGPAAAACAAAACAKTSPRARRGVCQPVPESLDLAGS
jgi:hypothetical protein